MPPEQYLKNVPGHIPQISETDRPNSTKSHHSHPALYANINYDDPGIGLKPAHNYPALPHQCAGFMGSRRAWGKGRDQVTNEIVEAEAGRAALREKALEKASVVRPRFGKLEIPDSVENSGESGEDTSGLPTYSAQGNEDGRTSTLPIDLVNSDDNEKLDVEEGRKAEDIEHYNENEEDESPIHPYSSHARATVSSSILVSDTEYAEEDSD